MSNKFKAVCADCSHTDVTWAVINRGLLICDQCCSIHRSLGRHISQLKSLKNRHWRSSQLNMVQTLNNGSINSLWEHTLSDPRYSKKKPQPTDPLHPNKAEFIRAKYQDLAYVLKFRNSNSPDDLNRQLHSSVRTANLETSLRLLIQGADPNYYHNEKGNYAINVAISARQMEQVELLISYGADPNVIDSNGNSLTTCAKNNDFPEVEVNIIECQYEVTDTFCNFLCNRKPDHKTEHFFIPSFAECTVSPIPNEQISCRLLQLSNTLFEELVMDVFDEVDRRDNEAFFQGALAIEMNKNLKEKILVPFLPVNPVLSTMRNQGRQKLARLSDQEFVTLVWDILVDCKRRQNIFGRNIEDEPLYDSVASDEDYVAVEEMNKMEEDLQSRLVNSELRISELINQVVKLQKKVDELKKENNELRNTIYHNPDTSSFNEIIIERRPTSLYNIAQQYINSSNTNLNRKNLPKPEEVLKKADQVTKGLQELSKTLRSIEYYGAFTPCVENVRISVTELSSIFPQDITEENICVALRTLNTNTIRLKGVCTDIDTAIDKMRNCAFNMAKANRQILTHFQC